MGDGRRDDRAGAGPGREGRAEGRLQHAGDPAQPRQVQGGPSEAHLESLQVMSEQLTFAPGLSIILCLILQACNRGQLPVWHPLRRGRQQIRDALHRHLQVHTDTNLIMILQRLD